jgi:hypothetical protein
MALYIHFTLPTLPLDVIASNAVYTGQDIPTIVAPERVAWIQADGQELTRCIALTGLPENRSVMKIYGDLAQHVVGNWK